MDALLAPALGRAVARLGRVDAVALGDAPGWAEPQHLGLAGSVQSAASSQAAEPPLPQPLSLAAHLRSEALATQQICVATSHVSLPHSILPGVASSLAVGTGLVVPELELARVPLEEPAGCSP